MTASIRRIAHFLLYFQIIVFGTCLFNPLLAKESNRWSIGGGVAVISNNHPGGILQGEFEVTKGDSAGEIYNINVSYVLKELNFSVKKHTFAPRLEVFSSLGLVDEKSTDLFYNVNAALAVRWIDFPWSRYLHTTIMTGGGLNYSQKIFRLDIAKRPNDDRSHLKFLWPLEVTFAIPKFKNHSLVFFNHHISGGHVMDAGGIDSFGVGYRYKFH